MFIADTHSDTLFSLGVVKRPLALEEKVAFVELMEEMSDDAPPKGFECSVLLEEVAKVFA